MIHCVEFAKILLSLVKKGILSKIGLKNWFFPGDFGIKSTNENSNNEKYKDAYICKMFHGSHSWCYSLTF